MTTDEIVVGIDRSLQAIAAERARLVEARAELVGPPASHEPSKPSGRRPRNRGTVTSEVLEALDAVEPRTAGDIAKITKITRTTVGATLARLVANGKASKAKRGYVHAEA